MVRDDLANAYAVLGLPRHAREWRVKRQYKTLVRRWHPDRFMGDRQAVADATIQMQAINEAYALICERTRIRPVLSEAQVSSASSPSWSSAGNASWTSDRIQEVIDGINDRARFDVRVTASRLISLVLTASVMVHQFTRRGGEGAANVAYIAALPLACIWFAEEWPGAALVRWLAWVILVMFLSFSLVIDG